MTKKHELRSSSDHVSVGVLTMISFSVDSCNFKSMHHLVQKLGPTAYEEAKI